MLNTPDNQVINHVHTLLLDSTQGVQTITLSTPGKYLYTYTVLTIPMANFILELSN